MTKLETLYRYAEKKEIEIDDYPMKHREAFSIMDIEDGDCYIAIDRRKITSEADERTKLSHEIGHCVTGSFYNVYSGLDVRQKHENRADKWAIRRLIKKDALDKAIAEGYTEFWQLAEYFGVNESLIRKAVCLYTYGNVSDELYF